MFLKSRENSFLYDILNWGFNLPYLQQKYPELLAEALRRTPETLSLAAYEWKIFADVYFRQGNRTVPDLPIYVEIQEALGIYGRSRLERAFRQIKRRAQKHLNVLLNGIRLAISKVLGQS
jgi:hypothetical protein